MKKFILSKLLGLGLISGAFAAGSYVENFEGVGSLSYVGNKSTSLGNGAEVYANNGTAVNLFSFGGWKALRLIQDTTGNTVSTYVVGAVESPGTRVNSFTASFDVQFKAENTPADRFSFNFGNLAGTLPRDGEAGLWVSGQTGSMLSLVWDFYDNTTPGNPDFVGSNANKGVELYRNGSLVSGSQINNPVAVQTGVGTTFTRVNVRYDEELNGGTLILNTGGTVAGGNLISGGTDLLNLSNLGVSFSTGDRFAFSGATGGADMDVFLDNISIQTVPEPSSASLLVLGIGGLMALRRRK